MSALGLPAKAISASRNAVAIASRENDPLDLAIYKYSLASALGDTPETESLLIDVVKSLRSDAFADLRRQVARAESFEIYSTARGDVAAYISILNRAQLRLARLYEDRGDVARAREQYANVLRDRTDDATALAAIARLDPSEQNYKLAFDANPFSLPLIRDYQKYLGGWRVAGGGSEAETTGDQVRFALQQMQVGQYPAAIAMITTVQKQFPDNDTLAILLREIEEKRNAFIARYENRAQLDKETFTGTVVFDQGPPFETGTIDGTPFRFSEPMNFNGAFAAHVPLRLTYRILGPTQLNGADALLLEPLRLEPAK
jgi:tetratricopeptide (TPR) repeat protein